MNQTLKDEIELYRALEKDRSYSGWSPARTEAIALIDKILAELSTEQQCGICGDHDCAGGLPCATGDGV